MTFLSLIYQDTYHLQASLSKTIFQYGNVLDELDSKNPCMEVEESMDIDANRLFVTGLVGKFKKLLETKNPVK